MVVKFNVQEINAIFIAIYQAIKHQRPMKTKAFSLIIALGFFLNPHITKAQDKNGNASDYIPSIGLHTGALSFIGDVGGSSENAIYTNVRLGYGAYLEKNFGNIVGARVNFMMGKLSQNEFYDSGFRNFESDIMQIDARAIFDFDNDIIINKGSYFSPFLGLGFGYLEFDPYGDLEDDKGNEYHYWADGTIRDMPESDTTIESSQIIKRDYVYETQLDDSVSSYQRNTFTIPLQLGFKFKVSDNLFARVSGAYHMALSDHIDNYAEGGNDNYLYTSFSIQYNFGSSNGGSNKKASDKNYKDVDFASIENTDTDKDGVSDFKDYCPSTAKGIEVDDSGCPPDTDNDGVPDYKDKEPNTPEGTRVNSEGITLTDEMIEEQARQRDSVQVQRTQFYSEELSEEERKELKEQYKDQLPEGPSIPEKYKFVDADKDGYITAKEVTGAIDGFFEGTNDLDVKDLNDLVDFFFEQ